MGNNQQDKNYTNLFNTITPETLHVITGVNGAGKSRFFEQSTSDAINEVASKSGRYTRLICLSGTMHDKFPREVYMSAPKPGYPIVYLGNKVNNNMISDIAPFRILVAFMLNPGNAVYQNVAFLQGLLKELGFDVQFGLKFRYRKGRKSEAVEEVLPDLTIGLNDHQSIVNEAPNVLRHLDDGNLILSDIQFSRDDTFFSLSDLSSDEKQYLLALLGASFCGAGDSIIFFDEPENSLHPAWQLRIAKDISSVIRELHGGATMVIATHSPLVASTSTNEKFFLCDLPGDEEWRSVNLFGRSSDTVLREQFHLASPRSPDLAELIGKCLGVISSGNSNTQDFRIQQEKLRGMDLILDDRDPLAKAVTTILSI